MPEHDKEEETAQQHFEKVKALEEGFMKERVESAAFQRLANLETGGVDEAVIKLPVRVLKGLADLGKAGHPRTQKILEQCLGGNEPFIVFRAKDIFTPMVIAHYVGLIEQIQPGDSEQQQALLNHRDEIVTWQRANAHRVRYPD